MSSSIAEARRPGRVDYDRFRLRAFVASLEGTEELEVRAEPTPLSAVARALEANPRAVRFDAAGPERAALVGNVVSSRSRLARAFGVPAAELLPEILRRLRNAPQIVEVDAGDAPVREVVRLGADADLTALPVHVQHGRDGGPYISAAIDFARDAATGSMNVGLRRLMLRGRRETGIDLVAPSDLRAIAQAAFARGEALPLSIVVGAHPIDYFAATMRVPGDELNLLASLRGAPLPVVKSLTNELFVPADAEWVIEGELGAAGYVEPEGPYGEFLGYYGGVKTNPVFRVTAITGRRDALFQTMTIGGRTMSRTDTAQLAALRTEVLVWRALESAVREPVAVCASPATGGAFHVRIALRQRVPGEARNAIAAAFGCVANVKHVWVVDPDVDVFSDEQMEWALGTRFQADRDLVVQSGFRTLPLDPSLRGAHVGAKAGFDLTVPFGGGAALELSVPEPPRFEGRRFPSVRDALADGPKSFEELVAALGSDDGREVTVALEALRDAGLLQRDRRDGRYLLAETTSR